MNTMAGVWIFKGRVLGKQSGPQKWEPKTEKSLSGCEVQRGPKSDRAGDNELKQKESNKVKKDGCWVIKNLNSAFFRNLLRQGFCLLGNSGFPSSAPKCNSLGQEYLVCQQPAKSQSLYAESQAVLTQISPPTDVPLKLTKLLWPAILSLVPQINFPFYPGNWLVQWFHYVSSCFFLHLIECHSFK